MRSFISAAVVLAAAFLSTVLALDPTDEYRDADVEQSGYLPNHNMDPAIVNSPQFGQLWKKAFNQAEQVRYFPFLCDEIFKACCCGGNGSGY
jgi:iron transport multicopper oxidase